MSDNAFTLVAKAKDEITGPVTAAANTLVEQLERIDNAVSDVEKSQRAQIKETIKARQQALEEATKLTDAEIDNFKRLQGVSDDAKSAAKDFGGFIEDQFTKGNPGLALVVDVAKQAGAAISAAAAKIYDMTKAAADAGDAAFTTSQRIGLSTEFITGMGFAAEQAGTSFVAIERGVAKLAQNANAGSKVFAELGIALTDNNGQMKTSEALFLDSADAIAKIENPMLRLARTQELFGKGSKELLPLLMEGRAGLQGFAEEAERLGLTIDSKTAAAADRLNDTLALVDATSLATTRTIGEQFVPGMTAGAEGVVEFNGALTALAASFGPRLQEPANGVGVIFRELSEATAWAIRGASDYPDAIAGITNANMALIPGLGQAYLGVTSLATTLGFFAEATDEAAEAQKKLADELSQTTAEIKEQEKEAKKAEESKKKASAWLEKAEARRDKRREDRAKEDGKKAAAAEDKEVEAALKRLDKEAKIVDEGAQLEQDSAEDSADAVEAIRNENAQALDRIAQKEAAAENKRYSSQLSHAREIAKETFKEHKKERDRAERELHEIQALGVQAAGTILDAFTSAFAGSADAGEELGNAVSNIFGGIDRESDTAPRDVLKGLLGLTGKAAGSAGGSISDLSSVLGFSEGGFVPMNAGTPGQDSVRAMLTPGEFVLPVNVVDAIRGARPSSTNWFANGGLVGGNKRTSRDHRAQEVSDAVGGIEGRGFLNDLLMSGVIETAASVVANIYGGPLAGAAAGAAAGKLTGALAVDPLEAQRDYAMRVARYKGIDGGGKFSGATSRLESRAFNQVVMLGGGEAGLVKLERDQRATAQSRIDRNQLNQNRAGVGDRNWWAG